jgi:DNA-directed RNA polymerase specialized sigma24 family protein
LILRYVEGLRLEEVATILKQPLGTVKSNAHRAVVALRESISKSRHPEVAL